MNNFTKPNSRNKNGQLKKVENQNLKQEDIELVKNYLDKLPENCEKISNQSLKKVVDFAKSYRVLSKKTNCPVEMHLN